MKDGGPMWARENGLELDTLEDLRADDVRCTRARVLSLCVEHDVDADAFDADMGIRDVYPAAEVMEWLGY